MWLTYGAGYVEGRQKGKEIPFQPSPAQSRHREAFEVQLPAVSEWGPQGRQKDPQDLLGSRHVGN